jgi:hypothetical protein
MPNVFVGQNLSWSRATPPDVTLGVFRAGSTSPTLYKGNLIMSKAKAPKPAKATNRKLKYDPDRILKLWENGKSISEIAQAMKPISRLFVHRTLTTKFKSQYEAGQKARAVAREKAAQ